MYHQNKTLSELICRSDSTPIGKKSLKIVNVFTNVFINVSIAAKVFINEIYFCI